MAVHLIPEQVRGALMNLPLEVPEEHRNAVEREALFAVLAAMIRCEFATQDGLQHICQEVSDGFATLAHRTDSLGDTIAFTYASQFVGEIPRKVLAATQLNEAHE
ncbi:MAG: hypothetical protein F4107_14440 [Gemmatimonadetes bacterium]|nr:hypothetical protein [Gemmatimonadota bacterium]MYD12516.1 hypothetical protein [Gemmatimonadota bacterium]MYI67117.1 hypothetical protein [Gemmatimonadota bacterium]